jgi:hypothetical protein
VPTRSKAGREGEKRNAVYVSRSSSTGVSYSSDTTMGRYHNGIIMGWNHWVDVRVLQANAHAEHGGMYETGFHRGVEWGKREGDYLKRKWKWKTGRAGEY